jgi:hypothetical protein
MYLHRLEPWILPERGLHASSRQGGGTELLGHGSASDVSEYRVSGLLFGQFVFWLNRTAHTRDGLVPNSKLIRQKPYSSTLVVLYC